MKLYNPFKRVGVPYIYEELIEIANEYGLVNDHAGSDRMDFCFPEHWDKDIFRLAIWKNNSNNIITLIPKRVYIAKDLCLKWNEYGDFTLRTGDYWELSNGKRMFLWDWNFYKKQLKERLDKISKIIRENTKLSKKIELHLERFKNARSI